MKRRVGAAWTLLIAGTLLLGGADGLAQSPPDHGVPGGDPVPPPLPKPRPPKATGNYRPVLQPSEEPWGLEQTLIEELYDKASVYETYTKRFTCNETARLARYNNGTVSSEKVRRYGYLLTTLPSGFGVHEIRQEFAKDGSVRPGAIDDEDPFPAAYAWVFLFSRFNEPYFSFRMLDDRFDGFDWVLEFEFRGSLPFTTGKDIRQWQGRVILDAVTKTPLEIVAEPVGQSEKIEAMYRRWSNSFNVLGMRTGPKPLGHQARVQFRHRKEGLTFPTELRYDTFRAVAPQKVVQTRASIRKYDGYLIYRIKDETEIGDPVRIPEPR
ncbi:MAG: hypothetical protein GTN89_01620 [Acidobacteria bacterium]|nr:hypothetical protein [Acidobacteriota bacterium]NIM61394.1 hypothetical protein [Acidobacteriota bacterium]NIO58078.1 hypothetical protein [Acidobacteriota bacterium]NIQ29087.1 hypothetical protein [Acidobacteriota bacterium]NIQ83631.1 hypothetical protein [Acidobacteriota bacterium]